MYSALAELWRLLCGRPQPVVDEPPVPAPIDIPVPPAPKPPVAVDLRGATFKRRRPRWTDASNRPPKR